MPEPGRTDREGAADPGRGRERQLQFVADHAPILLAHVDADRRFKFVNRPYAERFGLHPRDLVGRTVRDVLGEAAYARIRPHIDAALGGHRVEYEADVPYAGIGTQAVRVAYEPERDAAGRVVGYVAAVANVSDRKRAEAALRENEERLRTLSDNLPNGAVYQVVGDAAGRRRFLYISAGVERLFGVPPAEALADADALYGLVHPDDLPRVAAAEAAALRDATPFDCEFRSRTRSGDLIWVHARSAPRRLLTGDTLWEGSIFDVTERRRAERRRATRLAVPQVLAEAATVDEAVPRLLEALCGGLGWDVGAFWREAKDTNELRCAAAWHGPAVRAPEFVAMTRRIGLASGVGLPGRVWAGGQSAWIADVTGDPNFPRAAVADREGLHGACAFPVRLGDEFLGVIEFFSRRVREPDADLLELMTTVGSQLGQFIERKRAEGELRRSERELADFFDNATVGLHWVGPDGTILRANRAELDLLGYRREEYVGRHIAEFHADPAAIYDMLRRLASGEEVRDWETRMRCKDGSVKHVLITSSVFREGGRFVHTRCFTRDVTEHRRAAEALRVSEERFARFMQYLPGLAWIKDVGGRYAFANDAAVRAFRTTRADLYGKTDEEVFPPPTADQFQANDRQALAGGAGVQVVEALEHDDGVLHHSLVSKFPIPGPDGRPALVGGMAIDITELMRAEQALREADRRKDEFLATLAHELRNPLAPIRNSLEVMRLARGNPEVVEQSQGIMERQLRQMIRLIDDLLDVSRISRGKLQLRRERVGVADVVRGAVEASRPLIEEAGHRLTVALPPDPVELDADPARLAQVFANLLTNAAKYTDRGGQIWLTAERQGTDLVVSVRDTGIGIAADHLPRLFEMFSQAAPALERSQGGLGIGLSLVKGLVEMHGGRVTARSEGPGRGSEFVVRLPAAAGS